jgi:ABC-type multidrug transport system fused ATPase/permease subunit
MILPLRAVLLQVLLTAIAVAIETPILFRGLPLNRRQSMKQAALGNIAVAVVGWLFFFAVQAGLPAGLQEQLISYVFFDRLFLGNNWKPSQVQFLLVLFCFVAFLANFFLKFYLYQILEEIHQAQRDREPFPKLTKFPRHPSLIRQEELQVTRKNIKENQGKFILYAHATSNSVVLLLLLLRQSQM